MTRWSRATLVAHTRHTQTLGACERIRMPPQRHQRAFNPEYRMRESISPAPSDRFGQRTRERGCNPRLEVHPIPRRAINNIPILDTIHLEINRQPIGKPGQIDFEIDNLRSLVRSRARALALSSRSSRLFFEPRPSVRRRDAPNPSKCHRIRDRRRREEEQYDAA